MTAARRSNCRPAPSRLDRHANRRVDIVLEPAGQQSVETYPDDAPDARILWARKEPSLKRVEAAKISMSVAEAHSNPVGK